MGKLIDFNIFKSTNISNIKSTVEYNNRLYILIGIPCSGKTYYANKYFNKPNTVVISSDEIRNNIFGTYECYEKTNKLVFDNAKLSIKQGLIDGFNVVFDATNTNSKNRKSILKIAKENGCKTTAIVFPTALQTCVNRNLNRKKERQVPLDILLKMSTFKVDKVETEGFDEVKYIR